MLKQPVFTQRENNLLYTLLFVSFTLIKRKFKKSQLLMYINQKST